jgi:RNA polymerase sigma factor (sigma-70 family)
MTLPGVGPERMTGFEISPPQQERSSIEFEALAMPLFGSVYNFARWLTHNQNDAEDLVQETYLKALRGFGSFQPGTNFRAWMFKIMKNSHLNSCSSLDRSRTVAMEPEEGSPPMAVTSETPESLLIENHGIDAVRRAIEQLPAIFREVVLLRDVEDASYRKIAEILSIPQGTVMSRLARARRILRESLNGARATVRSNSSKWEHHHLNCVATNAYMPKSESVCPL